MIRRLLFVIGLLLFLIAPVTIAINRYAPDVLNESQHMAFTDFLHSLFTTNHSAPKTVSQPKLPTDPISGQSAPYNNQYLQFANNSAQAGSLVPYSPQTITDYGFGGALQSPGSGVNGGGGGGAGTVDTSGLQGDIRNKISAIQQAYDSLTGNIDQIVNQRANQNNQLYNQQYNDLGKSYSTTAGQLQNAYGARGLTDSSFSGNAQDQAAQTYQQNLQSILGDQNNTNAQLGQFAQSSKAQYNNAKNQYNDYLNNLGQYSPTDLQSLAGSLQDAYGKVQDQTAGLGTNEQFLSALNQIAPQANQGTSQLATQLQQLVTSSAPQFAKKQLAQGLIKQAQLTDPGAVSYWNDYYNKLLTGQA